MRSLFLSVILSLIFSGVHAQVLQKVHQDTALRTVVINGDTLPHIDLKEVPILPRKTFKNQRQEKQYWKLVYNIRKVLPYSKIVAATVNHVESKLGSLPTERERRRFIKATEDSLWKKYEPELREMTITQGKLLFKLVDRETSNSTYYWIDSFRGSVSAFFWQGMARLFGTNLKSKYDPKGEDAVIEQIVTYIEKGYI